MREGRVPEGLESAGGGDPTGAHGGELPADEFAQFLEDLHREVEESAEVQGGGGSSGGRVGTPRGGAEEERSVFLDPERVALGWVGAAGRLRQAGS
jgi:hypothetical protein